MDASEVKSPKGPLRRELFREDGVTFDARVAALVARADAIIQAFADYDAAEADELTRRLTLALAFDDAAAIQSGLPTYEMDNAAGLIESHAPSTLRHTAREYWGLYEEELSRLGWGAHGTLARV